MKLAIGIAIGFVAAPVIGLIAALLGLLPISALSEPPRWEVAIGSRALDASLEKRAHGLKNPIAADDAAALTAGMKLYRYNCAGCHGGAKERSDWGSKGFYPRVPQFAHDQIEISPEEAFVAIHDGVRYSGMGAWRDLMKADDMWRVANFVSHVHALPPPVDHEWRNPSTPSSGTAN